MFVRLFACFLCLLVACFACFLVYLNYFVSLMSSSVCQDAKYFVFWVKVAQDEITLVMNRRKKTTLPSVRL